jgi:hypothetical protein
VLGEQSELEFVDVREHKTLIALGFFKRGILKQLLP